MNQEKKNHLIIETLKEKQKHIGAHYINEIDKKLGSLKVLQKCQRHLIAISSQ